MDDKNQENLKLYFVSNDYLDHLRQVEPKIPLNKPNKKPRPFVGVVLSINNNAYFAPLSSQKHGKRTDFKIMKSNEQVATVRCSFMFPIHKDAVQEIDFTEEMRKDRRYTAILINEIQYINADENKEKLLKTAAQTYENNTKKRFGFERFCCDFKKLEAHAIAYRIEKTTPPKTPSLEDLLQKTAKAQIQQDFPHMPEDSLHKIELLKNHLLQQYSESPQTQYEILKQIHDKIPDIASGKIALPDPPQATKDKNDDKGR